MQVTKQIHHGLQALQRHKRDLHAVRCWSSTSCTEVLGGWSGFWLTWWTLQLCYKWTANVFFPMASYSCTNKAKCKKALVRCIMLHHSWIVATQVHHPFTLSSSSVSNKWTKQRVMFSTSCIPKWWNPCFGFPSLSSNRSLASLSFKPKARQLCILNLPDAPTISCFWRNKCLQYKQSVDILNLQQYLIHYLINNHCKKYLPAVRAKGSARGHAYKRSTELECICSKCRYVVHTHANTLPRMYLIAYRSHHRD